MIFSIISCNFISLFCYVICKDDYSSEYENMRKMYDEKQQASDSRICFGLCKHGKNETSSQNSKELTTVNEYSDSSEGEKRLLDYKSNDEHLNEIREKASQKYAHPDDQELYLAARTYTPTIKSSEISSLIHSVNSRYKHILSSNNSYSNTKIVRTVTEKTVTIKTKRPRFTIFRAKHTISTLDYNEIASIATDNTNKSFVSSEDIHETKNNIQQNNHDEEENPDLFKSVADPDSFKSFLMAQASKRNNHLNKFIESIDEQNVYGPELSVTTEDDVFNSSYYKYIEKQIDDFEERHRQNNLFGQLESQTVIDEKKEECYEDNLFPTQVFKNSAELLGKHYLDKLGVSPDKNQHVEYTEKVHYYNKENVQIGQQTRKNIENPETKAEPYYKSEYYENPEGVIQSKEATAFDKSQFYRFANNAQNKEDAGDAVYDKSELCRLNDVQNNDRETGKRGPNKTLKIPKHSIHLNKTKGHNKTRKDIIGAKQGCQSCSNKTLHLPYQQRGYMKQPQRAYMKQPQRRYHHHHHHHKKHHHNRRRGPYNPYMPRGPYMPPNPFLYNEYCPPPFPYPPQYYQQPQQHPHFFHFTTPHPNHPLPENHIGVPAPHPPILANQMGVPVPHHVPGSSMEKTTLGKTEDQYNLYLQLKDIFKPVENVLQGVSISSPSLSTTRTTRRITQSTTTKRYRYTIPPLPMAGGTMNPDDIQKYLEKHFNLPPPPPVNSSTDNPGRVRVEDYLPKDIFQDQRYFYTGCTRSILDHHPDYPEATTSPRKHTRRQRHYRPQRGRRNHQHRQQHHHCCCHHRHRRRPRKASKNHPRRRYFSGGIIEERYIESKDIRPEDNEEGVTGLKSFDYTSFETLYRGLKYNSEKPEDHTKPSP